MAFPEAATFVLCVCQHAELCVSLASHHPAHPAQPTARDPACGIPQAPRAPCSTAVKGRPPTNIQIAAVTPLSYKHLKERE